MTDLITILKFAAATVPFLLLALLARAANLKKEKRSCQFPMPFIALIVGIVCMVFLTRIYQLVRNLFDWLLNLLGQYVPFLARLLQRIDPVLICFFAVNILLLLAYIIVKRILVAIFGKTFKTGNGFYEKVVSPFYEYHSEEGLWFIREKHAQLRGLLKALYYGTVIVACLLMVYGTFLYTKKKVDTAIFYPVFALMIVGELFFFMDGLTCAEWHEKATSEEDSATKRVNYMQMREVLRKLFPDKLGADATRADQLREEDPVEELVERLMEDDDPKVASYGRFMRRRYEARKPIDRNYLYSGKDLLCGKSVLFSNPFYWDFIPYIFYPIQRTLLRNKKVLILLGRNGTEEDILKWAEQGLIAVNGTPDLFTIGVLHAEQEEFPDVGILTRSDIHDQRLHEACGTFFAETEFVVVIEPSKLLTTAQIGLNGIAKRLQKPYAQITWCCVDKNCDGLVDALSHALLADLREVSATNRHGGMSSYMLWETDHDRLQHRLLPNISRYLGFGTELSFAGLKNQIEKTIWYGGDAFPVHDIHWIASQYYHDLLNYAELPATQQMMNEKFIVSPNLWDARISDNAYITVEDEDHNMFEMNRVFSTRANQQSFVNILSDEYLLRDYMADNAPIFEADAKAIPMIVADYVRTERNVALRLILMMTGGMVREDHLKNELLLIGIDTDEPITALWDLLLKSVNPIGTPPSKTLVLPGMRGQLMRFDRSVIRSKERYDIDTGTVYTQYYIDDAAFIRTVVYGLQNADCIVEDEKGQMHFLGSELRGHIFQRYLPGQFFTKDGKYYEMLMLTPKGQMLVRRAADHIDGRVSYRQDRTYRITSMVESDQMGASREIDGMKIARVFADFTVETPSYWKMDKHGDFAHAKHVTVKGIPARCYHNKQMLRIELPKENMTDEVRYTITTLLNEVFRSIFAENQPYLIAAMPGAERFGDHPLTYMLNGENVDLGENTIYLIEDSELDLGLLVSAERSLIRLLEIICDYLDWHLDTLARSKEEPKGPIIPEIKTQPEGEESAEGTEKKKKTRNPFVLFGRFLMRIFRAIAAFFKKLFKRKPKKQDPTEGEGTKDVPEAEQPAGETPDTPVNEPVSDDAENAGTEGAEPTEPAPAEAEQTADDGEEEQPETDDPAADDGNDDPSTDEGNNDFPDDDPFNNKPPVLMSRAAKPRILAEYNAPETEAADEAPEPEDTQNEPAAAGVTAEFEDVKAFKVSDTPVRKPYCERYYLLFGGDEMPKGIVPEETLAYLIDRGYGDNSLKQARANKDLAEIIARELQINNGHLCDFCGRPLTGIEYEVLADGRERCTACSRTAIKTADAFEALLKSVLGSMKDLYGVEITKPVRVQMVNAKKLHRKLKKTFVPTGNHDGRTVGVAIQDKSGYSILVENGAPRIRTMLTLAHELTHIWQYLNWDAKAIRKQYGKAEELEIYEGMAKWAEIQFAYFVGEMEAGKREEILTLSRNDEYGRGFVRYLRAYDLSRDGTISGKPTPFTDKNKPL